MSNSTHDIVQQTVPQGEIILYQPDETTRLEVRLENDTVWLNRLQLAELFGRDVKTIGKHINNALKEELHNISTVAKFAIVQMEGSRQVTRTIEFYNLDMVISVGYRVKSDKGVEFRVWANNVLKDYLLRGYSINYQMRQLAQKVNAQQNEIHNIQGTLADHQEKIDFFVRTNMPPVEGIFYDGQIFDAYVQIADLIKQAKKNIILIDNYIDETTLTLLGKRKARVKATIYTRPLSSQQLLDVQRYNQQYPPVTVHTCQKSHDRFLIIDNEVYLFGASLKDAGKKLFAYIKMQETTAEEILNRIK